MNRSILSTALLGLALPGHSLTLPSFGSGQARIPEAARLDTALSLTWEGIKARSITAYGNGLVHRPKSEYPGDAVSEGQGYGMLLAVLMNDQTTFNTIWDATEKSMLSKLGTKASYNWWRCQDGGTTCNGPLYKDGPASDADQDIALSLLFADSLVKAGKWTKHSSPKGDDYGTRAQHILNAIWTDMVDQGRYLKPGSWGGAATLNPGYFAPAWYRVFASRDTDKSHAWANVIEQSYQTIMANPGASKGLLPDWSDGNGALLASGPGYNAYAKGQWFYKDAVRVHWRLILDWLWFGEPRAKEFLDKAYAFVSDPADANFFQIDGKPLPATDPFVFNGGALSRPRSEHSHLTVGMWACAAMSQGPDKASPWAQELLSFHSTGTKFWGKAVDAVQEDTLHNEMYFDQFLAWFGGAVLAGRFANIPEELADPNPSLALDWLEAPKSSPASVDFQSGTLKVTGRYNKAATWRVTIAHRDSSAYSWTTTSRSDSLGVTWNGQSSDGQAFPQGWCTISITAKGLGETRLLVWISHQRDLRANADWLVVDSCKSAVSAPNFGAWRPFTNTDKGGSSSVALALAGSGTDRGLAATYNLGTGGYQYAALQWNAMGWTGLAAAKKVRFRAKADHPTVVDFYVMQSDIQDDYLHVYDTIGTTWKTYEHDFSTFTPRLNGGHSLNMAKATALNWHIQADKCLNSSNCLTGTLTVSDLVLTGDMTKMYKAPAAAVNKPDSLPEKEVIGTDIAAQASASLRIRSVGTALRIDAPSACHVTVRDLSGRILARRTVAAGMSQFEVGSAGLRLIQVVGQGWQTTSTLHILP
ncbi:MAG: Endoglucanase precursor [Fibrobacterota bacterium]|jgi:endo-1,4-beta-D-glucanase Y